MIQSALKENTSIDVIQAKNGKYYLPKGTYTVKIDSETTMFEMK